MEKEYTPSSLIPLIGIALLLPCCNSSVRTETERRGDDSDSGIFIKYDLLETEASNYSYYHDNYPEILYLCSKGYDKAIIVAITGAYVLSKTDSDYGREVENLLVESFYASDDHFSHFKKLPPDIAEFAFKELDKIAPIGWPDIREEIKTRR